MELARFDLLRSDLFLELFNAVIEHELEFFELLRLPLELVDFGLTISDLGIFFSNLLLQSLHKVVEAF